MPSKKLVCCENEEVLQFLWISSRNNPHVKDGVEKTPQGLLESCGQAGVTAAKQRQSSKTLTVADTLG